ncbi:MAG: SDR family oxidoreductase [Alphaproteobacteria bacterium]|nr:SDR family oxidoreductase [Alphaproteobacteria bacterium]MBO6862889.1 SDR family oxidoreductase [Alphaproteobacteria bacterium]
MKTDLNGKRIVVTGGTGGIAQATAQLLLDCGAEVIVSARTDEKLEAALAELTGKASGITLDLLDPSSIKRFFEKVGTFDHLVTPASTSTLSPIRELDLASTRALLESKQWGQMLTAHYALPYLSETGSITLFSGTVTQKPLPGSSAFAAVGAASEAMARVWALELAPIRVNTVVPGVIDTPAWAGLTGSEDAAKETLAAIGGSLPVKRAGMPIDIAKAVLFVIDNEFVDGISLVVDGGHRVI